MWIICNIKVLKSYETILQFHDRYLFNKGDLLTTTKKLVISRSQIVFLYSVLFLSKT